MTRSRTYRSIPALALGLLFASLGSCSDDKSVGDQELGTDLTSEVDDTSGDSLAETEVVGFDTQPGIETLPDTPFEHDVSPGEGQFGAPCQGNGDCVDGYCVEGPEGFVCTKQCQEICPDEYDCRGVQSGSGDVTFLCLPRVSRVCVPCKADYQCPNGACLELGGSGQCSYVCEGDDDCTSGYTCAADTTGTHAGKFCQPRSGSCDCTPELAGAVRTCRNENDFGLCYGVETCDADLGWTGCTAIEAVAEVCDGRDNNCNALVDEGLETSTPCENTNSFGTCRGVSVCVGTQGLVCTAAVPEAETCDFRDNDCDGDTDEGRGEACTNENSFGRCPGVLDCVSGSMELVCAGQIPGVEVCNYDDDDCDGSTDEGFDGVYESCSDGRGICQRFGFIECTPDGTGTRCNAVAGPSTAEKCDFLDNDCDGETDEGFGGVGDVCFAGEGLCRAAGTLGCNEDGTATTCNAVIGQGQAEACDLLDNDCDGVTDNGFKDGSGKYAANDACGNCFTDCTAIYAKPNGRGVCDATGTPTCALACNAGYFNLNGVPDDGCEFQLETAIYVGTDSVGATDDGSCGIGPVGTGTGNHPCRTIAHGIGRAQTTTRAKVIVSDGLYSEAVTLVSGISVVGGYRADNWQRHLSSTGTVVRGPEGSGDRKAVIAIDITAPTVFEGFVVNAANAVSTGANSYAMYVRNSTNALVIRDNLIFAGLGGPGSTGTAGTSGENGVVGSAGKSTKHLTTCTGNPGNPDNAGGSGGQKTCTNPGGAGTTTIFGGTGGASVCPAQGRQEGAGVVGQNAGGSGGVGGWGHEYVPGSACYPTSGQLETGINGSDAAVNASQRDGTAGTGCSDDDGAVSGNEWRGTMGGDGGHGNHGAGGGGGGAGSGSFVNNNGTNNDSYDISGSGGGGGSGGCAGWRGGGGIAGGGSFGVFVLWLDGSKPTTAAGVPVINDNVISRNQGGPGGNGGNGGAGGDPGGGGSGGAQNMTGILTPVFCIFGGAKGGFGSRGGHGGGGGGACGGASFDIFAWGINGQAHTFDDNMFANGNEVTGGTAGSGGNSSNTTRGGTAGVRGASGTIRTVN